MWQLPEVHRAWMVHTINQLWITYFVVLATHCNATSTHSTRQHPVYVGQHPVYHPVYIRQHPVYHLFIYLDNILFIITLECKDTYNAP